MNSEVCFPSVCPSGAVWAKMPSSRGSRRLAPGDGAGGIYRIFTGRSSGRNAAWVEWGKDDSKGEIIMNEIGLLAAVLTQLPVYLVWLVGLILALAGWKKHPSVSLVALIGFVILFLLALVTQLTTVRHGVNWSQAGIAFLEALIRAGAWGLVLAAIFGWRK